MIEEEQIEDGEERHAWEVAHRIAECTAESIKNYAIYAFTKKVESNSNADIAYWQGQYDGLLNALQALNASIAGEIIGPYKAITKTPK